MAAHERLLNLRETQAMKRRPAVQLRSDAARLMQELSEELLPHETGGILVGYRGDDVVHITDVIGPGPRAQHGRSTFVRDGEHSQEHLDRLQAESAGAREYVGEWHSHPRPSYPSTTDRQSMREISQDKKHNCPEPLLLIPVRSRRGQWTIRAYQYAANRLHESPVELTPEPHDEVTAERPPK